MDRMRDRVNGWFDKHQTAWEMFMVALAIVFVALAFLGKHPVLAAVELSISLVFLTEFVVRLTAARSRSQYLLYHWMDVVALLPALPGYQNAPWVRMARMLRLLMVLRLLGALDRVMRHVKGVTAQPGLTYLSGLIAVMVLGVAGLSYAVERAQNEGLDSFSKAIYWAIVTVTTTGYGDIVPKTPLGRALSATLMIGGLVLWSLLTASVISYISQLVQSRRAGENPAVSDLKRRLDNLDSLTTDELVSLKGAVLALIDHRLEGGKSRTGPPRNQ